MQVFSRLVLVWGVAQPFPQLTPSAWYSSMLVAWATTEVVRYSYFVLKQFEAVPGWLNWLRYSGFLVLYPVGISSEVAMIVKAIAGPAGELTDEYPLVLMSILGLYVPGRFPPLSFILVGFEGVVADGWTGSVILYSHMLKQRRKYLGGGVAVGKGKKAQ
jgi:very-long-chain (3R)-3-hydroxyacyl-CoA dehydratase